MRAEMRRRDDIMAGTSSETWAKLYEGTREDENGCWILGGGPKDRYAMFSFAGMQMKAHRFSLIITAGRPRGDKNLACHRCNVPRCIRPTHLYWGDFSDNLKDRHIASPRPRKPPKPLRGIAFGARQHLSKLDDEKVKQIVAAVLGGASQASQGRKYGVSKMSITNIMSGKTWRHIPWPE